MSAVDVALFVGDSSKAQLDAGVATKLITAQGVLNVTLVGTAEVNGMVLRETRGERNLKKMAVCGTRPSWGMVWVSCHPPTEVTLSL